MSENVQGGDFSQQFVQLTQKIATEQISWNSFSYNEW